MTRVEQFAAVVTALRALPTHGYDAVSDDSLLGLAGVISEAQKLIATHGALVAGQVQLRSDPSLGSSGLAQRLGSRTPEELIRVTTGTTLRNARVAVAAGQLVTTPELQPWLAPVAAALTAGEISVEAAVAIRGGLGVPTAAVPAEALCDAAASLCAVDIDADRLFRLARDARDALDENGIVDRDAALRQKRSLRFWRTPDGGAQLHWVLDAESAAIVGEVIDRLTSPRKGGPRFVNPAEAAHADRILADKRTTEQLTADVFVQLLLQGADADSSQLLGTGAPVVRVLVAATVLDGSDGVTGDGSGGGSGEGTGHGRIEGGSTPIPVETIERLVCGATTVSVTFDPSGQVLDLGREQRLYSRRQRIALAARDGGCRWPGCERPPSWTEAHHIRHWARDHGSTDLNDGILLCRHHHLLAHNNHWEIRHEHGSYLLIPPVDVDRRQVPIPMPTKSAALRELLVVG